MKRESSWGLAAFVAVAATIGIAVQPWSQGAGSAGQSTNNATILAPQQAAESASFSEACSGLAGLLADFVSTDKASVGGPDVCYKPGNRDFSAKPKPGIPFDIKFVIATVPDPVHTHLSLIFDRFTEAIKEAAQDEHYLFESSWMPWDDDKPTYALLKDQDDADSRKSEREKQPGLILFRGTPRGEKENSAGLAKMLAVFIVGEESTAGIHREQFRNASAWVEYLSRRNKDGAPRVAILGPSFTGSFSSLDQLISDSEIGNRLLPIESEKPSTELSIYSGSANGGDVIKEFAKVHKFSVEFHSFLGSDDDLVQNFLHYIGADPGRASASRIAIISEEDTAFGMSPPSPKEEGKGGIQEGTESGEKLSSTRPLRLSYPRDISTLRSAYQSKSVFGTTPSQSEAREKNLPTNLADSVNKTHDTIRSYSGNQSPLSQEAYLLSLASSLKENETSYLILRGTNGLDVLFLANFFRRALPDTRIVIDSPDTLFQREEGATSLRGIMTLSTYPLFVQEQNWTGEPLKAPRRYFKSEVTEGLYIALRLLMNSKSLYPDGTPPGCRVTGTDAYLPEVECPASDTIPDYTPPLWLGSKCHDQTSGCKYPGPASWLSVVGRGTFWPLATLNDKTEPDVGGGAGWKRPEMPVSLKLSLLFILGLSVFHCWCCRSASFTSKPAFLAHFASNGDSRHDTLIAIGCFSIAAVSLLIGWGAGFFLPANNPFEARWAIVIFVIAPWAIAAYAYNGSYTRNLKIAKTKSQNSCGKEIEKADQEGQASKNISGKRAKKFLWMTAAFLLFVVAPLEWELTAKNSFLTHWRAVHLGSGVSPLVPVLLISAGVYVWFWFSLHGLALFGKERCLLPNTEDLVIKAPFGKDYLVLSMFSRQDNAIELERLSKPLSREVLKIAGYLTGLFFVVPLIAEWALPLRTLGMLGYSVIIDILFCACLGLMFAETWQLYRVWGKLHRLLAYLDYLPIRRTLAALHGFSWGNVWKMSGNVLDVRYKLLSRQLECRNHLAKSLKEKMDSAGKELAASWASLDAVLNLCLSSPNLPDPNENDPTRPKPEVKRLPTETEWKKIVTGENTKAKAEAISAFINVADKYYLKLKDMGNDEKPSELRSALAVAMAPLHEYLSFIDAMHALEALQLDSVRLAKWYAEDYTNPDSGDLSCFTKFQENSASTAGLILSKVLIPQWRKEGKSLVILSPSSGKKDETAAAPGLAEDLYMRNAEEFVAFPFLGFVQNILGRIRTIVIGIVCLFISVSVAISSYPFDPRHAINIVLLCVFGVIGGVIVYVYGDMHRDATLSYLTNTTPGELGSDFWFKIFGFGIGPFIGLMATYFPEIGDFVISWLQPGINSLK